MIPIAKFFAALAAALLWAGTAQAQPAASFRASCPDLRAALEKLSQGDDELIAIKVVGKVTFIRQGAGVVYLGLCGAPDPTVVCVTYDGNGLKAGDMAMASGTFLKRDLNRVLLDPCLNFPGDRGEE